MKPTILFCVSLLACILVVNCARAIRLEDVSALTFYQGQKTNARRSHSIPQLRCIGSECNDRDLPSVVQCTNSGSAGNGNIQWECKGELPSRLRFGRVNVNCEGFNGPNDLNVLEGSCGLEYSLISSAGSKGWGPSWGSRPSSTHQHHPTFTADAHKTKTAGSTLLFFVLLAIGAYFLFFRRTRPLSSGAAHRGGGFLSNFFTPSPFANTGLGRDQCPPSNTRSNGPGFWTGLFGGSAAGYLFGRRAAARSDGYRPTSETTSRARPLSPTTPTSPTRHESTGYGGTTRR